MTDPHLVTDPGAQGRIRVIGGPGTGKSTLLVEAAAAHIAAGAEPGSVLMLCASAQAAARTRAALGAAMRSAGRSPVVREPLVRTPHSYAFAVLRLAAQRGGGPMPRLVTGAEQDKIIRELLAGDLEDGPNAAVIWPDALQPALTTAGFATQLRDLMSRCSQRGVDGTELERLGRLHGHPEWVAAGRFARQYEQVMLLRAAAGMAAPQATMPALSAAELIGGALEVLATDAQLLAAEQRRVRVLLVDDAQHFDPQSAELVDVLAAGAHLTVVAGDYQQTVFGFRGADTRLVDREAGRTVTLRRSLRCAPAVAEVVSGVAARLPGATPGRRIEGIEHAEGADGSLGAVAARLAATPHAEAAIVADALRRAHLVDGVPWAKMAVIVRSRSQVAALTRAVTSAGVPVRRAASVAPPAEHPAVDALLTALVAGTSGLTGEAALALLTGPVGRLDPIAVRQLRRLLRRRDDEQSAGVVRSFGAQLVDVLTLDHSISLPPSLGAAARRVRTVLAAVSAASERDPRYALWAAWNRSRLERRWLKLSARGGSVGAQADRDLDAVTALFEVADDYVSRMPGATLGALVEHVASVHLPQRGRDVVVDADAVTIVSPHAALGREWDFVVLAGLQEGLWPNTVPRDGVLGAQRLTDLLDGTAGDALSRRAPVLAEERRLLVAALGRARRSVLVTAVDSDSGDQPALPSEFFVEVARLAGVEPDSEPARAPRVLTSAALIGRLRSAVCAPPGAIEEQRRARAAAQLARLAAAGVPGADPSEWHGMTALSTEARVSDGNMSDSNMSDGGDSPVLLSPSTVQTLADCPLRWMLERHGADKGRDLRSVLGSIVHALVAGGARSEAALAAELEKLWPVLPFDARWHSDNELDRHQAMLAAFVQWRAQTRNEFTEVGTEIDIDGVLTSTDPALPDVRVRGRVDRLERDAAGRLVVVDVKTGKRPVTKDDAQNHAQLAIYQLAVNSGLVAQGDQAGGGRLVYVGKPSAAGATEREQDALTPAAGEQWRDVVHQAAAATLGPTFVARVNDGCAHCPVKSSCPAQGRRS